MQQQHGGVMIRATPSIAYTNKCQHRRMNSWSRNVKFFPALIAGHDAPHMLLLLCDLLLMSSTVAQRPSLRLLRGPASTSPHLNFRKRFCWWGVAGGSKATCLLCLLFFWSTGGALDPWRKQDIKGETEQLMFRMGHG